LDPAPEKPAGMFRFCEDKADMNAKLWTVSLFAILSFAGCSTSARGPVPVPDRRAFAGEREFWDVYSVEFQGEKKVRTKVGYLYKKFERPDSTKDFTWWVWNLEQEEVGFLLADQKAYLIRTKPGGKVESEDLGVSELNIGVKKILQAPGSIELEKVLPKPSGPITPVQPGVAK
jgi:hypothetical protein